MGPTWGGAHCFLYFILCCSRIIFLWEPTAHSGPPSRIYCSFVLWAGSLLGSNYINRKILMGADCTEWSVSLGSIFLITESEQLWRKEEITWIIFYFNGCIVCYFLNLFLCLYYVVPFSLLHLILWCIHFSMPFCRCRLGSFLGASVRASSSLRKIPRERLVSLAVGRGWQNFRRGRSIYILREEAQKRKSRFLAFMC